MLIAIRAALGHFGLEEGPLVGVTLTAKSADVADGVRLRYVERGDPEGTPVVFLHGVTDSWRSFEGVLPLLPESVRAYAVTQRGHGDASRPATGYRFADFASDLAGFMDALGLETAVVVGHSMGAGVAQRFAIDHPGRTRGLVLLGAADLRENPGIRELWDSAVCALTDPVDPAFVREFQASTLAQPVPEAFLEAAVRESLAVPARVWRATFAGFLEDALFDDVDRIVAPTLIVWGERDALCPRSDQDALLAAIPSARLVIHPRAGHALHWEEPEGFASDLLAFLGGL